MERRFELRKEKMLAECEVAPQVFRGALERLIKFAEPFVELLRQIGCIQAEFPWANAIQGRQVPHQHEI